MTSGKVDRQVRSKRGYVLLILPKKELEEQFSYLPINHKSPRSLFGHSLKNTQKDFTRSSHLWLLICAQIRCYLIKSLLQTYWALKGMLAGGQFFINIAWNICPGTMTVCCWMWIHPNIINV